MEPIFYLMGVPLIVTLILAIISVLSAWIAIELYDKGGSDE